jgi:hypothetical protein
MLRITIKHYANKALQSLAVVTLILPLAGSAHNNFRLHFHEKKTLI